MSISSGRNTELNEAKEDLRRQTTSTDSYEDWLKDAGVVDRTAQINIMKDLFGTRDMSLNKPISEMTSIEKLQAYSIQYGLLDDQFKAIGRDRDRDIPHTFEKIDEIFDPKFINRMINGVETKVRQWDSTKGLEDIIVKPNAVRNIIKAFLSPTTESELTGTSMDYYGAIDWKYGGDSHYKKLSAAEKILVLQRDITFMKGSTTWQEELQRQQLIASTETENKMETDPEKNWNKIMDKKASGFGNIKPGGSLYDRGLPLGFNLSKGRVGLNFDGGNAEGVQKLLMAMGRQNQTKFMNDQQRDRFENILHGSVETKDTGYDEFGMYIKGADGERYNLPQGKTITINGQEMPLEVWQNIKRAKKQKGLAFTAEFIRSQMALLGQGMPIGTQQALLEAGIGGAAELAIQTATAYAESITQTSFTEGVTRDERGNIIDDNRQKAPAAFQAAQGRAEAMGRESWNREQAANRTMSSGSLNIMHWLPAVEGVTDADREAFQNMARSHNQSVDTIAKDVKWGRSREQDLGGMRANAMVNAKRLRDTILKRIEGEKLAAANYASILGISAVSALATLRDQSQGEQTLMDQVAFQQRLDAMSSGVV